MWTVLKIYIYILIVSFVRYLPINFTYVYYFDIVNKIKSGTDLYDNQARVPLLTIRF